MRRTPAALGPCTALTVLACIHLACIGLACIHDDPPEPTTTTTGDSDGAPTTTAGECGGPGDCGNAIGLCQERTCVKGACGVADLPEGAEWPSTYGDCRIDLCDGKGGLMTVLGDDPPSQVHGDCQRYVCDAGDIVTIADASDVQDDGNDCTVDACDGATPVHTPLPQDTPCGPGGASYCHSDVVCRPCKQVTDACEDHGAEPHDNQETAQNLGQIDDNDASGGTVCGTLRGANDIDWFTFNGKDALGNYVDPFRSLVTQSGEGARLCVYLACSNQPTTLDCKGSSPATAPLGQPGCCDGGTVAPSLNCDGLDDGAKVWIRVDNPQKLACVPYQLDYHF